ncbi:MAG: hypothetical protein ACHQ1H_06225, partial [Nitrososphaerales archaeon]
LLVVIVEGEVVIVSTLEVVGVVVGAVVMVLDVVGVVVGVEVPDWLKAKTPATAAITTITTTIPIVAILAIALLDIIKIGIAFEY